MSKISIVGAGQAGLQLGIGLLDAGHEVTVVSNRTPREIAEGRVSSSQCMFDAALQHERRLGLNLWDERCPRVEGISLAVPAPEGAAKAIDWAARLDAPAQSVDQRLKMPRWMDELERRGGTLLVEEAQLGDLERYAQESELVIVAAGKGEVARLFERDPARSPYEVPQRALALTYVTGMTPRPEYSAVCFNLIPTVGEYFVFPALTTSGECEIMVFEGIPGGPMDCWGSVTSADEHLQLSRSLLERFLPWEAERCGDLRLTDELGTLTGRITPVVRQPVARLPSGDAVLGIADAVVLNDPLTGQGSNSAAKCAEIYLQSINERRGRPFDEPWMRRTFERYWRDYAQWVVAWTNSMLRPPRPHISRLMAAAAQSPSLAATIAGGFDDPRTCWPWWFDEAESERLIEHRRAQERESVLAPRALRRALGQFATGVTVITAHARDGRRIGVTANSFTSLSLHPPLVLWCLDRDSVSLPEFEACERFAVNVLSAEQHHLSRQFAIPAPDKFAGVELAGDDASAAEPPLLRGTLAHFVCRSVRRISAGDHVIMIGEVERYEVFDGEPLVFHSGGYRIATRHPQLVDLPLTRLE
ncbi:MAG: styrene monooxygenase/indole monooxygenase family protein [Solirubrobacteraceae bacterium]